MQERTALGNWLSRLALERCITMADLARELDVSPSLLSLIVRGKRAIPNNFRDKIYMKFHSTEKAACELENEFSDMYHSGGIMARESMPYVVCKTIDKHPWTKKMMKLFASCVNKLTDEDIARYEKEFTEISNHTGK